MKTIENPLGSMVGGPKAIIKPLGPMVVGGVIEKPMLPFHCLTND